MKPKSPVPSSPDAITLDPITLDKGELSAVGGEGSLQSATSAMDATTDLGAIGSISEGDDRPVPFAPVHMIADKNKPRFSEETNQLLRHRLLYASLDIWIVMGLSYVGNLIAGNSQWFLLRTIIVVGAFVSYLLLRSRRPMPPVTLRFFEVILFGGVALQLGLMMASRLVFFAEREDPTSLVGTQYLYLSAFCLHVLTYGIFMPNTWRRAALVTTLIACVPYLVWYLTIGFYPAVRSLADANHAVAPIPLTLIAALIGTFGSHIINRTRREAFAAKQLLQYKLQEPLGMGGMGEVYRAEHILMKRPCAIKLIHPDKATDPKALDRFEKEVIATAKLSHWNTIDIYDYGRTPDGTLFYVMELLAGKNIAQLVEQHGPLPAERVVYLISQACDALFEAHQSGLIHRDIKPANLFVTTRGGYWDVLKVLDFGLVKETSDPGAVSIQGKFSGTPAFMAPEQAFRYDQVDARADIYALGAVAYYMLTGYAVFEKKSTIEWIAAHASEAIPPMRSYNVQVPSELEAIVARCLEKKPDDRYASTKELRLDLDRTGLASQWTTNAAEKWWLDQRPQSHRHPGTLS